MTAPSSGAVYVVHFERPFHGAKMLAWLLDWFRPSSRGGAACCARRAPGCTHR
jgi:hypothetical protein